MPDVREFREETRAWLNDNCPTGARGTGQVHTGSSKIPITNTDTELWLERMANKGWTCPTWKKEYGGGGLNTTEYMILLEEMRAINARPPLMNRGTSMVGPTIVEFGNEEQKLRLLPMIARGEGAWCQGYSEPGSGSDLASLRTSAKDCGDHFLISGQKIWTSDADTCDWIFILVRTDSKAPKHEGISFFVMPMDQSGITVRPIRLISGASPFCETFLDEAVAERRNMIGLPNQGWTVGKRLLQHERSGMEMLVSGSASSRQVTTVDAAKKYVGMHNGQIADAHFRGKLLNYEMGMDAYKLTQRRIVEEAGNGGTPGPVTSIIKTVGTELQQEQSDLMTSMMGTEGYGGEGPGFTQTQLNHARSWLYGRAHSIYSGSNEIQRNIIAKRVLGLPD